MLTPRDDTKKRKRLVVDVNALTSQRPVRHIKKVPGVFPSNSIWLRLGQSQDAASGFHQHLVPLWPLSSSGPREADSYLNGLITGGVHFRDVHTDEMKG